MAYYWQVSQTFHRYRNSFYLESNPATTARLSLAHQVYTHLKQRRHYMAHPLYYCHRCRTESLYYTSYEWLYDEWKEIMTDKLDYIWQYEEELESEDWEEEFVHNQVLPNGLCICSDCAVCAERPYYLEYQQPPEGGM